MQCHICYFLAFHAWVHISGLFFTCTQGLASTGCCVGGGLGWSQRAIQTQSCCIVQYSIVQYTFDSLGALEIKHAVTQWRYLRMVYIKICNDLIKEFWKTWAGLMSTLPSRKKHGLTRQKISLQEGFNLSNMEGKTWLCQICWRNCFRLLSSRNKYPQLCSHRVTEICCDLMRKCHLNKLKVSGWCSHLCS